MILYKLVKEVKMEKLNIEIIKQLIKEHKIRWTNHIVVRLLQRNIRR